MRPGQVADSGTGAGVHYPDGLVDELYDAIGNGGFAALPALLARAAGARSCSFQVIGRDGAPVVVEASYFPEAMTRFYLEEAIYRHDVWQLQTGAAPRGRALDLLGYVSDEEYRRSRFYQDMIRGFGDDTGRCVGMLLPTADGNLISIGVHRAFGDRLFEASNLAALDALRPHLQRVVAAQTRLDAARVTGATWEAALEAMPQAAAIVAPSGCLRMANARARAVLRRADGLALVNGRIEPSRARERAALAHQIHEALRRTGARGGGLLVSRADARRPYAVVVQPFEVGETTHALVLIADPDGERATREGLLMQLYRLTAAEAEVALLVAAGHPIDAVAGRRAVTVATAKTLLQRAYSKTGVAKASELARLVAELPA